MTPDIFPEQNKILLPPSGMANCVALSVFTDGEQCVSRWRATWRQRLEFLLYGRVWVHVVSGETQPPIALSTARTVFKKLPARR